MKKKYALYTLIVLSCSALFIQAASDSAPQELRVLYILSGYPQMSETYMHEEIASVYDMYDIHIATFQSADCPRENAFEHEYVPFDKRKEPKANLEDRLGKIIERFQPDVMHTHWLNNLPLMVRLAEKYHIPFTIRTHSFDVTLPSKNKIKRFCTKASSPWCLKLFCFPGFKTKFLEGGLSEDKIQCCWPVVNYKRFYNPNPRTPTGKVFDAGPGLWKKGITYFVDLADLMKDSSLEFNLYLIGYHTKYITRYNKKLGSPVKNISCVQPEDMPQIYRDHDWFIGCIHPAHDVVGFRVAVAEAQASGIGVCIQVRPGRHKEYEEYLGGGGFIVESLEELPAILSQPYPEHMRLAGLENAKKCDIELHKHLLTDVWDSVKT